MGLFDDPVPLQFREELKMVNELRNKWLKDYLDNDKSFITFEEWYGKDPYATLKSLSHSYWVKKLDQ